MLTDEEKKILVLLGEGESYQTIMKKMGFTPYKMRKTRESFLEKLGARNHTHAIYLAFSKGMIKFSG